MEMGEWDGRDSRDSRDWRDDWDEWEGWDEGASEIPWIHAGYTDGNFTEFTGDPPPSFPNPGWTTCTYWFALRSHTTLARFRDAWRILRTGRLVFNVKVSYRMAKGVEGEVEPSIYIGDMSLEEMKGARRVGEMGEMGDPHRQTAPWN